MATVSSSLGQRVCSHFQYAQLHVTLTCALTTGTGKSVLLRQIIDVKGGPRSRLVGITASTGIAAVNIGGMTLHSWAGIGLGQEDKEQYVERFFQKAYKRTRKRWRDVETLIIDEGRHLLFSNHLY